MCRNRIEPAAIVGQLGDQHARPRFQIDPDAQGPRAGMADTIADHFLQQAEQAERGARIERDIAHRFAQLPIERDSRCGQLRPGAHPEILQRRVEVGFDLIE